MQRLSPREQGDFGELSAMEWLAFQGYSIFLPVGHSPDVDLIAYDGERTQRVQVKTWTQLQHRRWHVMICTRGGNQSWNGVVKHFSPSRCDALFVHVGDGRRWFIPASAVEAAPACCSAAPSTPPTRSSRDGRYRSRA